MISQKRIEELRRELIKAQAEIAEALKSEKSRKRADLNRKAHTLRQMITPAYAFMSQAGQDAVVDRYFNHMNGGGTASFINVTEGFTQMSGLADRYDAKMLQQVRDNPRHKETTIEVTTKTMVDILNEVNIEHPDFISLDIEGGELAALQAFPFAEHQVGIWAIENNTGTREIADLMRGHKYDLIDFCGPDEIYALRKA